MQVDPDGLFMVAVLCVALGFVFGWMAGALRERRTLGVPGTSSKFSDFIRNATPEEKAVVYGEVMDKVSEQQRAVIGGTPPTPEPDRAATIRARMRELEREFDILLAEHEALTGGPWQKPTADDTAWATGKGGVQASDDKTK